MNKKYIMIGIVCGFLVIAGVCYSLTFRETGSTASLSSSLSDKYVNSKEQTMDNQSGLNTKDTVKSAVSVTETAQSQTKKSEAAKLYVHICGAVKNPGVYQVDTGARICELIKLSGGLKKDAAGDYINQARQVTDGERIYIPKLNEVESLTTEEFVQGGQDMAESSSEKTSKLININTAGAEELMTLPGIGQAKADSIIEYRKTNGNFKTIDDLMNISGIKEGVFNRISSLITAE